MASRPALAGARGLREHRKRQFAERSDRWTTGRNTASLFPSQRGTPMEPDNLRQKLGSDPQARRPRDMRFHDLRHTCVTLLLNLGVPPQVVRDIVGHSDIEVTMTIYAHVSLDDKRSALAELLVALSPDRLDVSPSAETGRGADRLWS